MFPLNKTLMWVFAKKFQINGQLAQDLIWQMSFAKVLQFHVYKVFSRGRMKGTILVWKEEIKGFQRRVFLGSRDEERP